MEAEFEIARRRKQAYAVLQQLGYPATEHPLFVLQTQQQLGKFKKLSGTFIITPLRILFSPDSGVAKFRVDVNRADYTVKRALDRWDKPNQLVLVERGGAGGEQHRFLFDDPRVAPFLREELSESGPRAYPITEGMEEVAVSCNVGSLQMEIIEADNLLTMDQGGRSDPYVSATLIYLQGKKEVVREETKQQTSYCKQTLAPVWNETLSWDITEELPKCTRLRVYDYDAAGGKDFMGEVKVPFSNAQGKKEEWLELTEERSTGFFKKSLKLTVGRKKREKEEREEAEDVKSPRGPVDMAELNKKPADLKQRLHIAHHYRPAVGYPCYLVSATAIPGAIFNTETSLLFYNEQRVLALEVHYRDLSGINYRDDGSIIVSAEEYEFVLTGFKSARATYLALTEHAATKIGQGETTKKAKGRPQLKEFGHERPAEFLASSFTTKGRLTLEVLEAMRLIAKDRVRGKRTSSDPFCKIWLLDEKGEKVRDTLQETNFIEKCLMPVWDESFTFSVFPGCTGLLIRVRDKDESGSDDFMGEFLVDSSLFQSAREPEDVDYFAEQDATAEEQAVVVDRWFALQSRPGRRDRTGGKVHIRAQWEANEEVVQKKEKEEELGIVAFDPNRRNSLTRLDFNDTNMIKTFRATYKGEHALVWCSETSVSVTAASERHHFGWEQVSAVQRPTGVKKSKNGVSIVADDATEVVLLHCSHGTFTTLSNMHTRFNLLQFSEKRIKYEDPNPLISWWRMHPFLTLYLHGALVWRHPKTLMAIWLAVSSLLSFNMWMEWSGGAMAVVFVFAFFVFLWFVEHMEFSLDWENLISVTDLDFVVDDFRHVFTRPMSNSTRVIMLLMSSLFIVAQALDMHLYALAYPFVASILVVVRSHLQVAPGERRGQFQEVHLEN